MTILTDTEIKKRMTDKELILNGNKSLVGPACYELRMGNIYYDLTEDDRRFDANSNGTILVKPGHRVVLITKEQLKIPNNIVARITSKGSLFSIGLSPVSTYADPGFSGNLGIVTQNFSDKYIDLPIGEPIAKVDFSLLSTATEKPYQGQHGFQSKIWPVRKDLQRTYEEIKNDPRVGSEEDEAFRILPNTTVNALKKLQRKQRKVDFSILFFLVLTTFVLAALSTNFIQPLIAVLTNLIATAVVAIFIWLSK